MLHTTEQLDALHKAQRLLDDPRTPDRIRDQQTKIVKMCRWHR